MKVFDGLTDRQCDSTRSQVQRLFQLFLFSKETNFHYSRKPCVCSREEDGRVLTSKGVYDDSLKALNGQMNVYQI